MFCVNTDWLIKYDLLRIESSPGWSICGFDPDTLSKKIKNSYH